MHFVMGRKSFGSSIMFVVLLFLFGSGRLVAQIPAGYYDAATGTGSTLKTNLYNIIKGHTTRSYDALYDYYETTDDVNNAGTVVWDMYSDQPGGTPAYTYQFNAGDQCGTYNSEADCFNREHSVPASWFGDASPMYSDLFHVVPTDGYVNNRRSNYPFGEVGSASFTSTNGSKVGSCNYPGYTGTVFEPIDAYKGDFARNYFYMATRYENVVKNWNSPMLNKTSYPVFTTWALEMLIAWHNADPVSQKEIDRNNAVYAAQNNRNPFIDHPEYVAQIWSSGASLADEPESHTTNFSAATITLSWTDALGSNLPDAYLVRMSSISFETISAPVDGIEVIDDMGNNNVVFGLGKAAFGGLTAGQTYYFKIYPYTGSGVSIDYKTDGVVQQVSAVAK